MRATLLALTLVSLCALGADPVYRWTDDKGVVHYTDKPPSKDAKPAQLPPLQTVPTYKAPKAAAAPAKPAGPPPSQFSVAIVSPTPDQTVLDLNGNLKVAVNVMPGLVKGFGLTYYVDGAAQNARPLPETTFQANGVGNGSHTIVVAMVDAAGKEVARSPEIRVNLQHPLTAPLPTPVP